MTEILSDDCNKIIENKIDSKSIKQTCIALGILTKNLVHIVQKMGLFESEINKDNPDD